MQRSQRNSYFLITVIFVKELHITVNKAQELHIKISTRDAQEIVRKAAALKNNFVMLRAIKDVALIASQGLF